MNSISMIFGQLYSNIVPFVVLLGILVFVHELGHFLVARMCGVRVEVFSLGFGKKILSYKKGDTTYCVSLIPLGGYVKMFGELPVRSSSDESAAPIELTEAEKKVSFTHKNVWQRIAIVLAGPLMNFFFAALVFTSIAEIGEEARAPIVASVQKGSPAETMGLQAGDRVLDVGGVTVQSYEEFQTQLNRYRGAVVTATVQTQANPAQASQPRTLTLNVTAIKNPNIFSLEGMIGSIEGLEVLARSTTVGVRAKSVAAIAGLKVGDTIVAVNGNKVRRWDELDSRLKEALAASVAQASSVKSSTKNQSIVFEVQRPDSPNLDVSLALSEEAKSISDLGIENSDLYLEQVVKDSPAELAGLQRLDRIIAIGDTKITKWEEVLNTIKSFDGKQPLDITVQRDGDTYIKKITPQVTSQMTALGQEDKRYTIGIVPMVQFAQPELTVVKSGSIAQSIAKGFDRTIDISVMTVFSFVKLFQGEVSHKNIGGMISIGKAAKDSFAMGLQSFLITMGILSISLFVLNLLPIPVLDGGHLVFYFIEAIKGSPLSVKKMEVAQQIGFALLMGLMVLALFNDFTKFFFKS